MDALNLHWDTRLTSPALTPAGQSAAVRALLAELLHCYFGISPLPEIAKTAEGKPYMPAHPELHISLSHCRGAVAAAVARRPVGIDIEPLDSDSPEPMPELLAVTFSAAEQARILSAAEPRRELLELWTRKESRLKAQPTGCPLPENPAEVPSDSPYTSTLAVPAPFLASLTLLP